MLAKSIFTKLHVQFFNWAIIIESMLEAAPNIHINKYWFNKAINRVKKKQRHTRNEKPNMYLDIFN